jgi:hypothetical protein
MMRGPSGPQRPSLHPQEESSFGLSPIPLGSAASPPHTHTPHTQVSPHLQPPYLATCALTAAALASRLAASELVAATRPGVPSSPAGILMLPSCSAQAPMSSGSESSHALASASASGCESLHTLMLNWRSRMPGAPAQPMYTCWNLVLGCTVQVLVVLPLLVEQLSVP